MLTNGCQLGWLLGLLVALHRCDAATSRGSTLVQANSTSFIAKFCFTTKPKEENRTSASIAPGYLNITVWAPALSANQTAYLLLLDDEDTSYTGPSSSWDTLSCEEKRSRAKRFRNLTHYAGTLDGQHIKFKIWEKIRPRFWYVAIADCSESSLAVDFSFHAVNEPYGWAQEFPTDRRFSLFVFLGLAVGYCCLVAVQLRANTLLADMSASDSANNKAAHPFVKLLLTGICFGCASSFASVLHTVVYAANGHGCFAGYIFAKLLDMTSAFVLISMLLLVSEGKCISYMMVAGDAHRMCRLLCPFLLASFTLELWGDYSDSQNYTTDYVYATPFGWAVVAVDILLFALYVSNLRATLAKEYDESHRKFYRTCGCIYGSWFLALPVSAILAQAVLAPYAWYMVSLIVTSTAKVVAYSALVVGLWPGNPTAVFKLGATTSDDLLEACPSPFSRVHTMNKALPTLLLSKPASIKGRNGIPPKLGFGSLS